MALLRWLSPWLTCGALACGGDASDVVPPPGASSSEMVPLQGAPAPASDMAPPRGVPGSSSPEPPAAPMQPAPDVCPWRTDDLLRKAEVATTERTDCGLTNGAFADELQASFNCFSVALEQGRAAEFTVINCVDCWIADTFVTVGTGDVLRLYTERDVYGDSLHQSRVDTCAGIRFSDGSAACERPATLFACQGPLADAL